GSCPCGPEPPTRPPGASRRSLGAPAARGGGGRVAAWHSEQDYKGTPARRTLAPPRTCCNRAPLQRNVPVLPHRIGVALVLQHVERARQAGARLARVDHVVDVAARRGDVGMRQALPVLLDLSLGRRLDV